MSSPSSFSGFSPRIRGRRNQQSALLSRSIYNRLWLEKTFKEELTGFYTRQAEGLPFIPAYLENTVYARLVKQQHEIFREHCSFNKLTKRLVPETTLKNETSIDDVEITMNGIVLTSPSETTVVNPTTQEIDSLQSALFKDSLKISLALQDLRLPTSWDVKAKGEYIDISPDHLQLTYTGSGKDDSDVSSSRANYAMRKQCGIYYFEVQIISKGLDGHIGIGFCRRINSLDRFPGWEEHSWGYHGENGNVVSGPGTDRSYGPKYGTGDIIGCGIDFRDMSAFYTKNGIFLGTAFNKIKDTELYPFVGFKTRGEKIEANFGSKPFKFDIQQFLTIEKQELLTCIAIKPTSTLQSDTINNFEAKNIADNVVIEYLSHNGYENAAKSLKKEILLKNGGVSNEDVEVDSGAIHRQEIRKALFDGEIDKVFKICSKHYPDVLNEPMILFRLKCRKFMEMVKQVQLNGNHSHLAGDEYEPQSCKISEKIDTIPVKRDASQLKLENSKKKKQKMDEEAYRYSFSDVMNYGNQLKQEYQEESKANEVIKEELLVAFSTLAYTDLKGSAVAYLFEAPQIESLASQVNSAILVSLGKYPNSSLERIYRQTNEIIELLVLTGNAKAALLQPEQDCFNPSNV